MMTQAAHATIAQLAPTSVTPRRTRAEANRDNARRSTGPRTERGKANSRMNALKHGILASQAVVASIEGRINRRNFERTLEAVSADLLPVGEVEEYCVQEIVACMWRKRRLLQFENRTAFEAYKRRKADPAYRDYPGPHAMDLPDDDDTRRVVRYEAVIDRTLNRALANLRRHKKERASFAAIAQTPAPAPARPSPLKTDQTKPNSSSAAQPFRDRTVAAPQPSSLMDRLFGPPPALRISS